jgi:hypothetical protein
MALDSIRDEADFRSSRGSRLEREFSSHKGEPYQQVTFAP